MTKTLAGQKGCSAWHGQVSGSVAESVVDVVSVERGLHTASHRSTPRPPMSNGMGGGGGGRVACLSCQTVDHGSTQGRRVVSARAIADTKPITLSFSVAGG